MTRLSRVKWVLPEPDSAKAIALREDFRNGIHQLHFPDTFPVETAHALTRAERRGLIQQGEALTRFNEIAGVLPQLHSYLDLLPRAIELSSQSRIGVYDCLYVVLAEREQCELITADTRLITAFSKDFSVISLDAL